MADSHARVTEKLSKRERQVMDVLYRLGGATVSDVLEHIPDPPTYSAVRATMRVLVEKGHARHTQVGPRYVYSDGSVSCALVDRGSPAYRRIP